MRNYYTAEIALEKSFEDIVSWDGILIKEFPELHCIKLKINTLKYFSIIELQSLTEAILLYALSKYFKFYQ
jgi:hypothetical protein